MYSISAEEFDAYNTKNGGTMTSGGMMIGLSILRFWIVGGARWTFFPFIMR
jgi:hypothetical protein